MHNLFLFRAINYLKYLLISMNRKGHGIHSPFVFDLVSRVFRNKIEGEIVCIIEQTRKRLINDSRQILVNDFGAGSVRNKTNKRKVSEIARYSPVPQRYGILLSNLAAEFGGDLIVELGTSLGISAMYMALSAPDSRIFTLEGSPEVADIARDNFIAAGIENIEVLTGSFDELLPEIKEKNIKPGLVFIDGDHRKEQVINNFNKIMLMSDSRTVVVIDDINYSKQMGEAWNEIKRLDMVTLTIDLYRMGIVFFRQGINRRNYVIGY
jgi:predicted O-methyltransferase YrrM